MPLKLKLPERKDKERCTLECSYYRAEGYNQALDEVQSLNPEREIDLEALAKEMFEICYYPEPEKWDNQDENTKSRWRTNTEIIMGKAHLWLKEKEKG